MRIQHEETGRIAEIPDGQAIPHRYYRVPTLTPAQRKRIAAGHEAPKNSRTVEYLVQVGSGAGFAADCAFTVFTHAGFPHRTIQAARKARKAELPKWPDARIVEVTTTRRCRIVH